MIGQTLSVEWEIVGCGDYRLQTWPPVGYAYAAAGCDALDRAVDIYMNKCVFDADARDLAIYDQQRIPADLFI